MLDVAFYLRDARDAYREAVDGWENPIGPQDVLLNDYLNLDVALSELMLVSNTVNANMPEPAIDQPDNLMLGNIYATAFVSFLMIGLKQQWTHLMVLEDDDLASLKKFPQMRLAHQFIGIKTMLLNAYHQRRQSDFEHAWRSFLKLGLFELTLSEEEINDAVMTVLGRG